MPTLSRIQAEALLRPARAGRPLYDDLRPAYTRLDPLVALLRRRGFTGLMSAAGRPGEGVVWFDHGRLPRGWLLPPEGRAGEITPAGAALAAVPWDRLLPEALARVRRHRGSPLAQQLEEAVNVALAPDAAVSGRDVSGPIAPEKGAVALQAIAEGLRRVAGAAFTERLLWTLARDFDCEAAVKHLLQPFAAEMG